MKIKLITGFLVLVALGFCLRPVDTTAQTATPTATPAVTLANFRVIGPNQAIVGTNVSYVVSATGSSQITGAYIDFRYDPSLFKYVNVNIPSNYVLPVKLGSPKVDLVAGKVTVNIVAKPPQFAPDSGYIAAIVLQPLAQSSSTAVSISNSTYYIKAGIVQTFTPLIVNRNVTINLAPTPTPVSTVPPTPQPQ